MQLLANRTGRISYIHAGRPAPQPVVRSLIKGESVNLNQRAAASR